MSKFCHLTQIINVMQLGTGLITVELEIHDYMIKNINVSIVILASIKLREDTKLHSL